MTLTGCALDRRVENYTVLAYTEDEAAKDDGAGAAWTFRLAFEDVANAFSMLPQIANPSGDGVDLKSAAYLRKVTRSLPFRRMQRR